MANEQNIDERRAYAAQHVPALEHHLGEAVDAAIEARTSEPLVHIAHHLLDRPLQLEICSAQGSDGQGLMLGERTLDAGGSMRELLMDPNTAISFADDESMLLRMAQEVASGLHYLHTRLRPVCLGLAALVLRARHSYVVKDGRR